MAVNGSSGSDGVGDENISLMVCKACMAACDPSVAVCSIVGIVYLRMLSGRS